MKQFASETWFQKHKLSCTKVIKLECGICMKQFNGQDRFTKHQISCTKIITCEFCSKSFLNNYNLKRHMVDQHESKCQQGKSCEIGKVRYHGTKENENLHFQ